MYGGKVTVYYFQGRGLIDARGSFVDDLEEISSVEDFLRDPRDRRTELKKEIERAMLGNTYLRIIGEIDISDSDLQGFLDAEKDAQRAKEQRNEKLKSLVDRISAK
jgi:hypothetical protein